MLKRAASLQQRVFEPPYDDDFDASHIDLCEAVDVMEMNVFRAMQRIAREPGKPLEVARDWVTYLEALCEIKSAHEHYMAMSASSGIDSAIEATRESAMKASIVRGEIELKFMALLGEQWMDSPPTFRERLNAIEDKEARERAWADSSGWRNLYRGSRHLARRSRSGAQAELRQGVEEYRAGQEAARKRREARGEDD